MLICANLWSLIPNDLRSSFSHLLASAWEPPAQALSRDPLEDSKPDPGDTAALGALRPSIPPQAAPTDQFNDRFVALARKVVPAVVNISSSKIVKSPLGQGNQDDIFRRFFEDNFGPMGVYPPYGASPRQPKNLPKAVSLGTGFVIDTRGLILTNNHVVADANDIKIMFTEDLDETPTDGEVVGRDKDMDVALIRVKTDRKLSALTLGQSTGVEVGEGVMAVGNPFGHGHSVTHGIISAKGRLSPNLPLASYLQTDAAINQGNSGGPLIRAKTGEVIGINNAIDARAHGIGFAIPSTNVLRILDQLKQRGYVEYAYMGARIGDLTPELAEELLGSAQRKAPIIMGVNIGEPAARAGIRDYDVVLEVNGRKVHTSGELVNAITEYPVGSVVSIKVQREQQIRVFQVTLTKRPGLRPETMGEELEPDNKRSGTLNSSTGLKLQTLSPAISGQLGLPSATHGVIITGIAPRSPAELAELAPGDIITKVDQTEISSVEEFLRLVRQPKHYLLRVMRGSPEAGEVRVSLVVLKLRR